MKKSTQSFLIGTLIGAAAGATIGILYAPDKGTETRKKIKDKAQDLKDDIEDKFDEIKSTISEKVEGLKKESETPPRTASKKTTTAKK